MKVPVLFVLCAVFVGCCDRDPWSDVPTECVSSLPVMGGVETYVIEGRSRGIQYRLVPDVLGGSLLVNRQGRLVPEHNEIGLVKMAAAEHPADASVQIAYTQALPDGGSREVSEVFRCRPLASK